MTAKLLRILCYLSITCITTLTFAATDCTHADLTRVNAIKWYRDSAERNALYREIFLMAENIIREKVAKEKLSPHQWGVIFDIDETLLDNSEWNYQYYVKGNHLDWDAFAAKAVSVRLPGSKRIIDAIHQMGGYVNLVSDRSPTLLAATQKNLKDQGLYYDQVLLDLAAAKVWYVDKNSRFAAIVNGNPPSRLPAQKIIAWFGDNIQDFPKLKQKRMHKQNSDGAAFDKFGVSYFALPDPMYGTWDDNKLK